MVVEVHYAMDENECVNLYPPTLFTGLTGGLEIKSILICEQKQGNRSRVCVKKNSYKTNSARSYETYNIIHFVEPCTVCFIRAVNAI